MPLPAGFKVNGSVSHSIGLSIPPRIQKLMDLLDALPLNELLTSVEVSLRLGRCTSGHDASHPALTNYHEKVDNKLFWGNQKSIAKLRTQLAEPEDTDENQ